MGINKRRIQEQDIARAAIGSWRHLNELRAAWTGGTDDVYRIHIGSTIEVICLGLHVVDEDIEGKYTSVDELPKWAQERIAVLSMIKIDPPQTKIEGIGMRVAEDIYWIVRGD